jgi:hypothetical protein
LSFSIPAIGEELCGWCRRRRFALSDRDDKSVAAARNGLDAAPLSSFVIEDATQRGHLDRQITLRNSCPRPDGLHNQVLRKQFALPLGKEAQEVESARAERDGFRLVGAVDPEQPATV